MSMNEIQNDYGLLDVLTSLCKNGSSGRLQITVGTTRGAFFFKDGQLVDERVGTLTGFAAVNLAVTIGAPVLNFDSSIAAPTPRFTETNERMLLKTRFGIDAAVAEVQSAKRSGGDGRLTLVVEGSAATPSLEPPVGAEVTVTNPSIAPLSPAEVVPSYARTQRTKATSPLNGATTPLTPLPLAPAPPREANVPAQQTVQSTIVPMNMARPEEPTKTVATSLLSSQTLSLVKTHTKTNLRAIKNELAFLSQSIQTLGKQSVNYIRKRKTAVRAASIALIVIPGAVGFMSYWSKGKETVPVMIPPPPAASSLRVPAVAPSRTPSEEQSFTTKPLTKMPSEAVRVRHDAPSGSEAANPQLPATRTQDDTNKTISSETVADRSSKTRESAATKVEPNQPREEKQLAKQTSRGIAVEVRVEGGRVSEAFIKNRRPGLEGYEATALRLARQRRYPKETTTSETLFFQVNGEH